MISDFAGIVKSEYEFEGLDGQQYKVAPLGLREIGQFCIWIQFRDYEIAKQIGVPKEELKEIYEECKKKKVSFDSLEFLSGAATPEGTHKLLYFSLKLNHPKLLESDISKIVSLESMKEITDKVYAVSGLLPDEGEQEDLGESEAPKE